MSDSVEIIHNEVLTSFDLDPSRILLDFGAIGVDLIAHIEIIAPNGQIDKIESAFDREGDLGILWRLVGQKMMKVVMDVVSFRLTFEDGTLIQAKHRKSYDFVTVYWSDGAETGYPTVLHDLGLELR